VTGRVFDSDPPRDVKAVRTRAGTVFRRDGIAWAAVGGVPMYWNVLRAVSGAPLTEHRDDPEEDTP